MVKLIINIVKLAIVIVFCVFCYHFWSSMESAQETSRSELTQTNTTSISSSRLSLSDQLKLEAYVADVEMEAIPRFTKMIRGKYGYEVKMSKQAITHKVLPDRIIYFLPYTITSEGKSTSSLCALAYVIKEKKWIEVMDDEVAEKMKRMCGFGKKK